MFSSAKKAYPEQKPEWLIGKIEELMPYLRKYCIRKKPWWKTPLSETTIFAHRIGPMLIFRGIKDHIIK